MAHNLLNNTMAFVGEVPWHDLGKKVPPDVTSSEMLVAAGLDWRVDKVPAIGARVLAGSSRPRLYDRYFLQRDPTKGELEGPVLGMVTDKYEVLQNEEAFAFFEPLINTGGCRYEAAGALGNGERVWVRVRMTEQIHVAKDDAVDRFLLLANSHDGRSSLSVRFTPVRVVCQNTLNLATKGGDSVVTIRHSRHMRDRMAAEQVTVLLELIAETYSIAAKQFRQLAATKATKDKRETYLQALFPKSDTMREKGQVPERWQMVDSVLEDGSVTPRATRDTLWGLYNAVTRAEDYRISRERDEEARLNRIWFGTGADLKIKALRQAVELCG